MASYVWGFDPGLSRCGYAALAVTARPPRPVAVGVVRTTAHTPVPERLAALRTAVEQLFCEHRPEVVAVERVLFQANARTAMSVGQAAGVVMAEAARAGAEVLEYSPNEVKVAVCGDGAADKSQVERMVRRLLGISAPLSPADAADAAAVALTHLSRARFAGRVRAARPATR